MGRGHDDSPEAYHFTILVSMIRLISISFALLLLAGCSLPGSTSEGSSDTTTVAIEKNGVSMSVPTNWKEATSSDLPTPKQGSVVLAYSAPDTSK